MKKDHCEDARAVTVKTGNRLSGRGIFDNCPAGGGIYILAGLILALGFFVFKDFLLLKNVYLFKDIGSDSINIGYTSLIQLSQYVRCSGLPGWSFSQGMGQNIFPFMAGGNFLGLFFILPPDAVAYGIIYVEVLKALLAGIFFYLYLRTLSLSLFSSIVGGMLFAFSGYIVLGSCWLIFSSEALLAALLLYAFEKFFKEHVWFLLPIPVALMGAQQPFYWFSYTIFLFIYATARFLQEGGERPGKLPAFYLKLLGLGLFGAAISAVFSFSNIFQLLQSPRVGGEASYFRLLASQAVFKTSSLMEKTTALFRFFSSDMLGTGSNFRGYQNYLEAPLFYCGLATLLLAPQIFYFSGKRRRLISAFIFLLCALPIIFPFFRWAFWGFTGDYYRTLSLVVVLFLLWLALESLSFIDKTGMLNPVLLAGTLAALLLALFFPYFNSANNPVDLRLRNIAAIFLSGYAALIYLMGRRKFKFWAQIVFLAAVCAELAYFSSITVNGRPVISARELGQKTGYNDYSVDAVAWLNSIDPDFFRVVKSYSSGPSMYTSLNDAQIQGYNGTASYSPFNQLSYVKFLNELGVLNASEEYQTRWLLGLPPVRPLLLTFSSVKYILARPGNDLSGIGFKLKKTFANVSVFENLYFLPLGFTYDKQIAYEDFKKLSASAKDLSLLKAFVTDSGDSTDFAGLEVFHPGASAENLTFQTYGGNVNALKKETLSFTERGQNRLAGTIDLKKKKLLFLSIPYDKGWKAEVDGRPAGIKLVNIGFMGLPLEKGHHSVELKFTPPLLYAGACVSAISLLLYGLLVLYSVRAPKPITGTITRFK